MSTTTTTLGQPSTGAAERGSGSASGGVGSPERRQRPGRVQESLRAGSEPKGNGLRLHGGRSDQVCEGARVAGAVPTGGGSPHHGGRPGQVKEGTA